MRVVEKLDGDSVKQFAKVAIEPKQDLRTDGSPTLKTLEGTHRVESQVIPPQETHKWLPWVHIAIANLKRFLLGTYHGVSGFHLQEYLDEFCYRFNRRWCELEMPNRLLPACLIHKPVLRSAF
jgi:ISXO2-like transposase domain